MNRCSTLMELDGEIVSHPFPIDHRESVELLASDAEAHSHCL